MMFTVQAFILTMWWIRQSPPSRGSQSSGEANQEATARKVRTAMRKVGVRCPRARAPELSFQGHRSKSGKEMEGNSRERECVCRARGKQREDAFHSFLPSSTHPLKRCLLGVYYM